jgi:hypothetical protein
VNLSRRRAVGLLLLFVLLTAACGKKGPPLAPLRPVPARVTDLTARRVDADVYLRFTIPVQNEDGSRPADLARLEIYGLSGEPVDAQGRPLDMQGYLRAATLIETIAVRRPLPPGTDAPEPGAAAAAAQGEVVAVRDRLRIEPTAPVPRPESDALPAPIPRPLAGPVLPSPPTRSYVVVGLTRGGRTGAWSNHASVSLMDPPPAPPPPVLSHTETTIVLEWAAPAAPAVGDRLPSKPLFEWRPEVMYNVYEVDPAAPAPGSPLNTAPLRTGRFEDPRVTFGQERCYALRALARQGTLAAEGPASAPACITPVDTFPPAAPTGLRAVGGAGAISLIWDASLEPDLAGYLVLRGEATGETLQALTADPIRETTFRDTAVVPGVRYVYAVVAVDTATPPNVSPESNRVEESAR